VNVERYQPAWAHIDRYEIIAEIGRGGMGVVYRAYEPALERTVALKVIAPQLAHEPGFVTRLRREAISAARLRHPNIALLYEFGQVDDVAFLAMEYVPGPSLRMLLETMRPDPERALAIVGQIAQALDYAHGMGIVHRDVKPGNILIGAGDHAVLIDFGLADADDSSLNTLDTAVLGTPHYMAPEQAAGHGAEPYTDQYALATVAYELLVGVPPFAGRSAAIVHAHLYDLPPPPSERCPDLPSAVDPVFLRALAKSPRDRFPTAGAFVQALGQALAAPPPPRPLVTSWWRLAGVLLACAAVLAAALLLPRLSGAPGAPGAVAARDRSGVPLPRQVVWSYAPGLSGGPALVAANGMLVASTLDGALLGLRADSGEVRWRKGGADARTLYGAPSAGRDLIYVGRADEQVVALSPDTGDPVWRRRVTGAVLVAPTLDGDRLIVMTDKGYLYVLQAGSGQVIWSRPLAPGLQPPAAGADRIFVSAGRALYVLDARDGAVLWEFDAASTITTRPAIAGDLVLVGTERGLLHALQIVDAREVYHFQANGAIDAAPAVGEGAIFLADRSGAVSALRPDSGDLIWHFSAGAAISATPLLAESKLLFGASNGMVYALDAQKGAALAQMQLGGSVFLAPALGDGLIFVLADRIYALGS
jgi:serine/threonine-protein kinase